MQFNLGKNLEESAEFCRHGLLKVNFCTIEKSNEKYIEGVRKSRRFVAYIPMLTTTICLFSNFNPLPPLSYVNVRFLSSQSHTMPTVIVVMTNIFRVICILNSN